MPISKLFAVAFILLPAGCNLMEPDCLRDNLSYPPASPVITVVNATTGAAICDAQVLAGCDGYDAGMTLLAEADDASVACEYGVPQYFADGSLEAIVPLRAACTLVVSRSGFATTTVPGVSPQGGGCTAGTPQRVTVKLQPN